MSTKSIVCPICERPSHAPFTPFCSKRCADVDLGRWLTGQYVAPGEPLDPANDDPDERS
jgi:hypothetical protein